MDKKQYVFGRVCRWGLSLALCILAAAPLARAQSTAVTLQVTDTGSQSWNNGTWTATLTNTPGSPPGPWTIGGVTVPNQNQSGLLSGTGGASITLSPNDQITPVGSIWSFQVCPLATAPCYSQSVSITGASQTVNLVPPAIAISLTNDLIRTSAYATNELTGGLAGNIFFNLSNNTMYFCTAAPCLSNWTAFAGGAAGAALDLSNLTNPTNINVPTLTFASAAGLTAGGTSQNVTLTPSSGGTTHLAVGGLFVDTAGAGIAVKGSNGNNASLSMSTNTLQIQGSSSNGINLWPQGTTDVTIVNGRNLSFSGGTGGVKSAGTYGTITNCASSASPAVCSNANAGRFVIAASATSVVVNTTAVTAASEIFVEEDQSLGSALSVTCNTGISSLPVVSSRVAGTSFTVTISAGLATNPVCYSYFLVN